MQVIKNKLLHSLMSLTFWSHLVTVVGKWQIGKMSSVMSSLHAPPPTGTQKGLPITNEQAISALQNYGERHARKSSLITPTGQEKCVFCGAYHAESTLGTLATTPSRTFTQHTHSTLIVLLVPLSAAVQCVQNLNPSLIPIPPDPTGVPAMAEKDFTVLT